jgi:hypothetical protein
MSLSFFGPDINRMKRPPNNFLPNQKNWGVNNIAFELFLDIVQWFDKDDSRQMRYSPSTPQFFWLGRKLFGGRFIRFMSGPKNESDILTGSDRAHCECMRRLASFVNCFLQN